MQSLRLTALLTLVFMATGCSLALGDSWEKMKVPQGMSMVYVFAGDDMGGNPSVHLDKAPDTNVATDYVVMVAGGYYPYLVPSGQVRVFTGKEGEGGSCLTFMAQEGVANYIRVTEQNDVELVEWMTPKMASPEISKTRRMSRDVLARSSATFPVEKCLPL